jgi:hypothetical protein
LLFQIKSLSHPDFCVDTLNDHKQTIGLQSCASQASQNFKLSYYHDISNVSDYCWDTRKRRKGAITTMVRCHQRQGNQFWKYDAVSIHLQPTRLTSQLKYYVFYKKKIPDAKDDNERPFTNFLLGL